MVGLLTGSSSTAVDVTIAGATGETGSTVGSDGNGFATDGDATTIAAVWSAPWVVRRGVGTALELTLGAFFVGDFVGSALAAVVGNGCPMSAPVGL
jgi:hypothetical protein